MTGEPRCLVLNGTVGVGKTTTAEVIGDLWREAGIPGAVIDADRLRWAWPAPPEDPHFGRLGRENLAAVAGTYLGHGARRLVLADVLETAGDRRTLVDLLDHLLADLPGVRRGVRPGGGPADRPGVGLTVVRLVADPELIEARLRERHRHDAAPGDLEWHLHRIRELAAIQLAAGLDDAVVDVTGLTPTRAAAAVLGAAGWDEPGYLLDVAP